MFDDLRLIFLCSQTSHLNRKEDERFDFPGSRRHSRRATASGMLLHALHHFFLTSIALFPFLQILTFVGSLMSIAQQ